MMEYLKAMKFSTFFLVSCGAVVQVEEAQKKFTSVVDK